MPKCITSDVANVYTRVLAHVGPWHATCHYCSTLAASQMRRWGGRSAGSNFPRSILWNGYHMMSQSLMLVVVVIWLTVTCISPIEHSHFGPHVVFELGPECEKCRGTLLTVSNGKFRVLGTASNEPPYGFSTTPLIVPPRMRTLRSTLCGVSNRLKSIMASSEPTSRDAHRRARNWQ